MPVWKHCLIRGGCLLLLALGAGCSNDKKTPPTRTPGGISREDAAKLLTGVSEQLDALKEELTRASPKPGQPSARPEPVATASPQATPSPLPSGSAAGHPCEQPGKDSDLDSLSDSCEELLAQTYAPVVYHSSEESNFPTNVDKFLPQTVLWFRDADCDFKVRIQTAPTQPLLVAPKYGPTCNNRQTAYANGTRSKEKQRTFYLDDLPEEAREGSRDAKDWLTYVHAYRNKLNGATIQYWRFYAYNDAGNDHGGDWEGIHVVLDSQFRPVRVGLLGHTEISYVAWKDLQLDGPEKTHPRIYSEGGGHASLSSGGDIKADGCKGISGFFSCRVDPEKPETFVRQETWKNGQVSWFSGETGPGAGLLNVGEKLTPLNGQVFIQYSGLWGSPGSNFSNSGYWGPAYNETSMLADGFLSAWATGMLNPKHEEAYPLAVSP